MPALLSSDLLIREALGDYIWAHALVSGSGDRVW